jgi:serine protease Do
MNTFQLPRPLPALALVAALASGAGLLLHERATAAPEPGVRDSARELSRAFRDVARNISPSVVGVLATREATDAPAGFQRIDPFQDPHGDLFRRFFGRQGEDGDEDRNPWSFPMPPFQMPRGQGTGVIVDADGIIATNNHVVAGAKRLEVTLQDGRKLAAEVVGTDPETDLALLRVKEKGLPAAKLGDSNLLEPGDWVVAVGNPFGLDHTVTVGVVSAVRRSGIGVANYENFIQTDAAINPGNSGGPLLNLDGEVIGINTAIRTSNGGSDGISFAIPSATLARVMPELVDDGKVRRGYLGVTLQPLTPELAKSFGLDSPRGALISEVLADTPASEAGLRPGDIVLSLEGKDVKDQRELMEAVAILAPGTQAELVVLRGGEENTVTVELGERPSQDSLAKREARGQRRTDAFGLQLGDLPGNLAQELGLSGGALVREVAPGSPAARAGLMPGDVILSVDEDEVRSADDADERLREAGSGARLLVRSLNGSARWLFLERGTRE